VFECFERIRDTARAMREALARDDWDEVAVQLDAEWENRKRLAPGVTTPTIDALIGRARGAGAAAAKVCGAGGGGCLVFLAPPHATTAVRTAVEAGGARLLDFRIESHGLSMG
jgi:D-glycero-alpha-D-manno-heptose-7-phosphate kinase